MGRPKKRRIAQVFTSTVAGGGYGGTGTAAASNSRSVPANVRAAYLGTLLAAGGLQQRQAVLTSMVLQTFDDPDRWLYSVYERTLMWHEQRIPSFTGHRPRAEADRTNLTSTVAWWLVMAETAWAAWSLKGGVPAVLICVQHI